MPDPIIIIGAGQAGAALAARLRALGYDGPLLMLGEEPVPPYQRPPLSKKYMSGELDLSRLLIRPESWYGEQDIELRLSATVAALSPRERRVILGDGSQLRYAKLALTTGARPRRLPASAGGDLAGVFTIRNLADVDSLTPAVVPGKTLLVVGGGYIGLEAAAVAAAKGLRVILVEMAPRILQRVACQLTADYFRELHGRHGVVIRESAGLRELLGVGGRLTGALMADGSLIEADLAVIGIGAMPVTALAEAGSMLGSGAVFVVAEGTDMLALATNIVRFFRNESCGKCVPCRAGTQQTVEQLEAVQAGKAERRALTVLHELNETMALTSICGLGQVALNPLLSVMKHWPEEAR